MVERTTGCLATRETQEVGFPVRDSCGTLEWVTTSLGARVSSMQGAGEVCEGKRRQKVR